MSTVREQTRRNYVRTAAIASLVGIAASTTGRGQNELNSDETIRVPQDQPTVQDAVDEADGGDLVLVDSGTYDEAVEVSTPELTIRGTDRNEVVLDGEFQRDHGVRIEADGVALENLTARHYTGNAFYWRYVYGFRGSYLTAYNNGDYGAYAYRSSNGRFEHSYASGHPDAGFYLGYHNPFDAVVTDVIAEHNALGYSGTSAGGNLTIRDSVWRHNVAGIVPNTLGEEDPPQRSCHIVGNEVSENHNSDAPTRAYTAEMFGAGILLWGGQENLVEDNEVRDHEHFGIAATANVVEPSGNVVRNNDVSGSGTADLALGEPAGEGNRFADNEFETSLPSGIEDGSSEGDPRVGEVFEARARLVDDGELASGDWREQPEPDDQPTMPDPGIRPRPAERGTSWDEPQ
ncbi:right-handed parallel beta-helix repeat-containing protein [Halomontanus rarus]|uniref:right-handed parallel beta-helix repeat-containing protein n=1 Tax=Halomontanus rarus TaxID=3034020 RepID=UPI0023E8EA48|nr:right-handed parallel beta-helix repeat-containing protein [Halovivax sp. TS33]